MLVSFIIPCFNQTKFLAACLSSFLWQKTALDYEIILVDNNSMKENTDDVYQKFFDKLPIYLLKQPKLPHSFALCRARNLGLKIAAGEWIATLDSDILLNENYFTVLKKILAEKTPRIITAERVFIDSSGLSSLTVENTRWPAQQAIVKSASNYFLAKDRRLDELPTINTSLHPWAYIHGASAIFPKTKANAINGYDESYDGHWGYEDVDFAYRIMTQESVKPHYEPGLYCYHLEPEEQLSMNEQRFNKGNNPNWEKICSRITGFKEYKEQQYQMLSTEIKLK